jgi:hypothetical protein
LYLYYASDDAKLCIKALVAKHYFSIMIMYAGTTERSNFDIMTYVVIIVRLVDDIVICDIMGNVCGLGYSS